MVSCLGCVAWTVKTLPFMTADYLRRNRLLYVWDQCVTGVDVPDFCAKWLDGRLVFYDAQSAKICLLMIAVYQKMDTHCVGSICDWFRHARLWYIVAGWPSYDTLSAEILILMIASYLKERKHWALHPQKPLWVIRNKEGEGLWGQKFYI